jgi:hypothetical protein
MASISPLLFKEMPADPVAALVLFEDSTHKVTNNGVTRDYQSLNDRSLAHPLLI